MHRLRMHVGRNAVAYVALFFALSGTGAMAAKSLITGAQIQDGTIQAADVASDTLGGGQIDESSLGKVPAAANADTVGGVPPVQLLRGQGYSFSRVVWGYLGHQDASNALDGVAVAPDNVAITFSCFVNTPDEPALVLHIQPNTFLTSWGVRVGDEVINPTVNGGGGSATWTVTKSVTAVGTNDFRMQASDENGFGYVVEGFTRNADGHCAYQAQVTITGQ